MCSVSVYSNEIRSVAYARIINEVGLKINTGLGIKNKLGDLFAIANTSVYYVYITI